LPTEYIPVHCLASFRTSYTLLVYTAGAVSLYTLPSKKAKSGFVLPYMFYLSAIAIPA